MATDSSDGLLSMGLHGGFGDANQSWELGSKTGEIGLLHMDHMALSHWWLSEIAVDCCQSQHGTFLFNLYGWNLKMEKGPVDGCKNMRLRTPACTLIKP